MHNDSDADLTVNDSGWNEQWNSLSPKVTFASNVNIYGWSIFWQGQMAHFLISSSTNTDMLYSTVSGGSCYYPAIARTLTPTAASTYSPPVDDSPWYSRAYNSVISAVAENIVPVTIAAIAIATVATAGILAPEAGAAITFAVMAENAAIAGAGGAGGLGLTGGVQGYSSGGWTGGLEGGARNETGS